MFESAEGPKGPEAGEDRRSSNELQTRAAICGAGLLLALIFLFAHLPLILLSVPVIILFLGFVADPEETHVVWYGLLNVFGIFDLASLTEAEKENYWGKRHYFWFGEVAMAAVLAGTFAVPAGIFLAVKAEITLAFIGAVVLFLPLFVFLPKLIQRAMKADVYSVIEIFGKNEQVKRVFWAVFVAVSGVVLTNVLDPVTAHQIVSVITGIGV